jgi:hypothetical protein
MERADKPHFLLALKIVWEVCLDPLDSLRQRAYWQVLSPRCTLEEFEEACVEVLATATFHRTPMPGTFLAAVREAREARKAREAAQRQVLREAAWHSNSATHQRLLADPRGANDQDSAMRACMRQLNAILGTNWRTLADLQTATERQRRLRQRVDTLALTDS